VSTYYSGRVFRARFQNPSQDFYVLEMVLDRQDDDVLDMFSYKQEHVVVRGVIPGLQISEGTWFGFEARWENHAKYGRQLVITKAPGIKGQWNAETAASMLAAHGVPDLVADRIMNHFRDLLVSILDSGDGGRRPAGAHREPMGSGPDRRHQVRAG
jgi:hypothetical protein